jgi:hypothetical protein
MHILPVEELLVVHVFSLSLSLSLSLSSPLSRSRDVSGKFRLNLFIYALVEGFDSRV